jgi:hypothetical protein
MAAPISLLARHLDALGVPVASLSGCSTQLAIVFEHRVTPEQRKLAFTVIASWDWTVGGTRRGTRRD